MAAHLNDSPVDEYVQSSTPEMRVPRETGNEERTWVTFIECITTDFRSPCASAAPSSEVNCATYQSM